MTAFYSNHRFETGNFLRCQKLTFDPNFYSELDNLLGCWHQVFDLNWTIFVLIKKLTAVLFMKIRELGEWKASFLTAATSYLEMTLRDLGSKDVILSLFDFRLDLPRNENSGSAAAKKQTCGKNSKNRVQTQTAKKRRKKSPQQFCRRFPRIACLWRSPGGWTRRQCRASSSPVLLSMLPVS